MKLGTIIKEVIKLDTPKIKDQSTNYFLRYRILKNKIYSNIFFCSSRNN